MGGGASEEDDQVASLCSYGRVPPSSPKPMLLLYLSCLPSPVYWGFFCYY